MLRYRIELGEIFGCLVVIESNIKDEAMLLVQKKVSTPLLLLEEKFIRYDTKITDNGPRTS